MNVDTSDVEKEDDKTDDENVDEVVVDETEDETSTKSFTNSIFSVNIIVMKCFKLTLHWDSLKNNCGFWFTMACFILVTSASGFD